MSLYKQIVKYYVHRIGCDIGPHGDLGVSGTPLRGVYSHLHTVEYHAAHDYAEICDSRLMCGELFFAFLARSAQLYDGVRSDYK